MWRSVFHHVGGPSSSNDSAQITEATVTSFLSLVIDVFHIGLSDLKQMKNANLGFSKKWKNYSSDRRPAFRVTAATLIFLLPVKRFSSHKTAVFLTFH